MNVIVLAAALSLEVTTHFGENAGQVADGECGEGVAPVFRYEDQ
jgi:hypothetical protein